MIEPRIQSPLSTWTQNGSKKGRATLTQLNLPDSRTLTQHGLAARQKALFTDGILAGMPLFSLRSDFLCAEQSAIRNIRNCAGMTTWPRSSCFLSLIFCQNIELIATARSVDVLPDGAQIRWTNRARGVSGNGTKLDLKPAAFFGIHQNQIASMLPGQFASNRQPDTGA